MMFGLVYKSIENVIYLFANESSQAQEFAIDPVQSSFEEIAFTRILRIEQIEQLENELGIDITFGDDRLEIGRL